MIPAFFDLSYEGANDLARAMEIVIPSCLSDSLIGLPILGSTYFATIEGDPTKGLSGFHFVESEGGLKKKVYKIEHQPTGSNIRFRKLNHIKHGECWEAIPKGE